MKHSIIAVVAACLCSTGCGRSEAAAANPPSSTLLHVSILADSADARLPFVHEAIDHWNSEFTRLGLHVRLDSGVVVHGPIPEDALRAASNGKTKPWTLITDARLRSAMRDLPGDVTIALSHTDVISFSVPLSGGRRGIVGIKRADVLPLSLPNTVRNVVAHELGHVLGLQHNTDSTTLMCGRPASCRPTAFVSQTARFFPLTTSDEQALVQRWR